MTQHPKSRFLAGSIAGAAAGSAIFLAASWFTGSGPAALAPALPELRAALGEGDYLFLPNRKNIWVVNRRNGLFVHYKFVDTADGAIERSHIARVDQSVFPPEDTVYSLSERNITDFLWVCNRRTGDFQLWRRSVRDGRLTTDPEVVQAARHLITPVLKPSAASDGDGEER
jgi:hypothetical protein